MQKKKTRQEIYDSNFLTKTDIKHLYEISWRKAKKIYALASEIDDEELGRYRIEDTKVRKTSVLKVYGVQPSNLVV